MEIPRDDFSQEELLALEKETLGLYVSSHPLKDLRQHVRREAGHLISQLAELSDGTITTIVGMVSAVKRITTKKSGETMAFVTIEGLEGSVEMLCFPSFYPENNELLVEDKVVKIKGRVDHKDESGDQVHPPGHRGLHSQDRHGAAGPRGRRRNAAQYDHRRPQDTSSAASPGRARWTCTSARRPEPGGCVSVRVSGSIPRRVSSPS